MRNDGTSRMIGWRKVLVAAMAMFFLLTGAMAFHWFGIDFSYYSNYSAAVVAVGVGYIGGNVLKEKFHNSNEGGKQ